MKPANYASLQVLVATPSLTAQYFLICQPCKTANLSFQAREIEGPARGLGQAILWQVWGVLPDPHRASDTSSSQVMCCISAQDNRLIPCRNRLFTQMLLKQRSEQGHCMNEVMGSNPIVMHNFCFSTCKYVQVCTCMSHYVLVQILLQNGTLQCSLVS
jgi:hypothetical protein